ncbi:sulfite exporter TauE/SafE family protein [bacterium]|nr:sulfite exporter TauE/SafE family protein [Akkermansiaceae bacterium]MDB4382546.1 sulfite exporter TauE/SafE family protein [Akkermansiaceae bacterium]MDB4464998.1 sulfite exporter TauE/SafE family protein [Akkermansiaceae bacterium]MDB4526700.1 sulfite exporter TauE/SafE family protein [bacterium]MDB4792902.1 sulfite exporter TauE/SafE family protein [bacterium]
MNTFALLGAALIGLALGLTGAGGSIITLPVLVYLADLPPKEAVGLSLFVVGVAALVGALQRIRSGEIHLKAGILFALSGMIGAAGGARLTHMVSGRVLMIIFAVLMLTVALNMLMSSKVEPSTQSKCHPARCLSAGFAVGMLTGFIGVGGGFLLMPALVKFAKLPLRVATGTSLAVISFNSAAGFFSHYGEAPPRWSLAFVFAGIAAAGVLLGSSFAKRLPVNRLRQGFAIMVILTGSFVLWQSWMK